MALGGGGFSTSPVHAPFYTFCTLQDLGKNSTEVLRWWSKITIRKKFQFKIPTGSACMGILWTTNLKTSSSNPSPAPTLYTCVLFDLHVIAARKLGPVDHKDSMPQPFSLLQFHTHISSETFQLLVSNLKDHWNGDMESSEGKEHGRDRKEGAVPPPTVTPLHCVNSLHTISTSQSLIS